LKKKEEKLIAKIQPNLKIKKLWDPNRLDNNECNFLLFFLVNEYIEKSKEIWNKEYIWSEEIALNNLSIMNFSQEKALSLIKEQNKEYFENIKGIFFSIFFFIFFLEFCITKENYEYLMKSKSKRSRTK